MAKQNALIKYALEEVISNIKNGDTPTEALKKTAEELDLNSNYIQRVGESLNVALTYKHFKTASDKAANFPIADIPGVICSMFGALDKKASSGKDTFFDNSFQKESIDYNKIIGNPNYKKAYISIVSAKKEAGNDKNRLSDKGICEKSAKYINKLEKTAEDTRMDFVDKNESISACSTWLIKNFKKCADYRTPFEEFESQVYSKYGKHQKPLLDEIYKAANLKEPRGIYDPGYTMFEPAKETEVFGSMLSFGKKAKIAYEKHKRAVEKLKTEKDYVKEIYKTKPTTKNKQEVQITPKVTIESRIEKDEELDPVLEKIKKQLKQKVKKEAGVLDVSSGYNFIGSMLNQMLSPKFEVADRTGGSSSYESQSVTNISRAATIQELLMLDPILSKENPKKVIAMYKQLLKISPNIADEKEILRVTLRQMVASDGLSPFDANQVSQADLNMIKQRIALTGGKA